MLFKVDSEIFERVPNLCVGAVIVENFDNENEGMSTYELLSGQMEAERQELSAVDSIKQLQCLKPYHETMKVLGINPSKYLCSIEALLTRIKKKGELPDINPAVNLGNYISIKHKLPVGVHDIGN